MERCTISGRGGYDIPCVHTLTGKERIAAVVSHGFGSSKESSTAMLLMDTLPALGIGVFAFDFPAHGDSPVDGRLLRVENCLDDLAAAEAAARACAPGAEIVYFSSSFGGYMNLIYLSERPHAGKKSFMRSCAVNMPALFGCGTPEEEKTLADRGYILLDEGYQRPLMITREFISDLGAHDVFSIYRAGTAELRMAHGEHDNTVPLSDARRFAEKFNVKLTVFPGGDHRLSLPGMPERVAGLAAEFFLGGSR